MNLAAELANIGSSQDPSKHPLAAASSAAHFRIPGLERQLAANYPKDDRTNNAPN
jgi:hypothetical protein